MTANHAPKARRLLVPVLRNVRPHINFTDKVSLMKKMFVAAMATLALFALAGCDTMGKGKGKAPVETNG